MITEERYKELLEELSEGHDVLFEYNGNKYFYSHCGENGDYLQKDLDGPRLFECEVFKGLHEIRIDDKELIEILRICDIDSVY